MRKCACAHVRIKLRIPACFCLMTPSSQLFEVDIAGVALPRRVSKLSRRNLRHLNMPPKLAAGRRGKGSVTVGSTHPANVAAAKKKADATVGGDAAATSTRTSPPRSAKSVASAKIAEQMSPSTRIPVASVAPAMAETTRGVSISFVGEPERSPKRAKSGVRSVAGDGNLIPAVSVPALPPLWNAWYSACCHVLTYVGDGGSLEGRCGMCGDARPSHEHTMLDPDQVAELKKSPGLTIDALMGIDTIRATAPPVLPLSSPRGRPRMSPKTFEEIDGGKTTGMSDDSSPTSSPSASSTDRSEGEGDLVPTDREVSKYSFVEQLHHYMERVPIREENRGTVELAVMVEAGSIVREMGTMTKERRESAFYDEYMNVLRDIPSEIFEDDTVREQMMRRFKGMRKGDMDPACLLRKYETEMTALKKFAYKFPGFGNLNKLPSGTLQIQHLRRPVVTKLWVANNPVRQCFCSVCICPPITPDRVFTHVDTGDRRIEL